MRGHDTLLLLLLSCLLSFPLSFALIVHCLSSALYTGCSLPTSITAFPLSFPTSITASVRSLWVATQLFLHRILSCRSLESPRTCTLRLGASWARGPNYREDVKVCIVLHRLSTVFYGLALSFLFHPTSFIAFPLPFRCLLTFLSLCLERGPIRPRTRQGVHAGIEPANQHA